MESEILPLHCVTIWIVIAPFIFIKCLRPVVKFWRQQGIKIVLYLDDGFVFALTKHECLTVSETIQKSLSEFGFLINFEKSIFYPTQNVDFVGLTIFFYFSA